MSLPVGFRDRKGDEFWSKPARDMAQLLVVIGGYDKQELLKRLINKVTCRNHKVQERHVLEVAGEMYEESKKLMTKD